MELKNVKSNLVAAHLLIKSAQEEIQHRVEKGYRMAEEDLKDLQSVTMPVINQIEMIDSNLWRYGRAEYGAKLFKPTARLIENNLTEK